MCKTNINLLLLQIVYNQQWLQFILIKDPMKTFSHSLLLQDEGWQFMKTR